VDLLAAAVLGVVQGLTEFLPVSSSGHLILARAFFGFDPNRLGLAFDVACHLGTLLAVMAYFRDDVLALLAASPGAVVGHNGATARLVRLIVVGTIPVVIVGGLFGDALDTVRSPVVVAATLAVGGLGLIVAERLSRPGRRAESIGYGEAFGIGIAQAAALVPGVSRSGATLTIAMLLGLGRPEAARFVFLLSLPAVAAAAMKEALELGGVGLAGLPVSIFAVGLVVSAIVGYLTIRYFLGYLASHSLTVFAYYRFALAAITVVWLLAR
jgi:undecaprenyl-diphosphatase